MRGALIRAAIPFALLVAGCLATPAGVPTPVLSASEGLPIPQRTAPSPTPSLETPTLTWEQERDAIVATLVASRPPIVRDSSRSPDGNWVAEILGYDCTPVNVADEVNALDILQVKDARTGETKIVETQVQSCGGLGAAGLSAGSWSRNSRYLYYTDAAFGMPEGCGWWIPPTKRLDPSDWSVQDLGNGPLSPDGEMMATWQDSSLLISSIEQGDIAPLDPIAPRMILGQIAWSPTGSALVYLQTQLDCYPWGNTLIAHVDLSDLSSRLLLESEEPSFVLVDWRDPNKLYLRDRDDNEWTYDLTSGILWKPE